MKKVEDVLNILYNLRDRSEIANGILETYDAALKDSNNYTVFLSKDHNQLSIFNSRNRSECSVTVFDDSFAQCFLPINDEIEEITIKTLFDRTINMKDLPISIPLDSLYLDISWENGKVRYEETISKEVEISINETVSSGEIEYKDDSTDEGENC